MAYDASNRADFYLTRIESLSLHDALTIYYAAHPQFTHWSKYNTSILRKMLRSHDISHIVYGCPTTLLGELQLQCWNSFGSVVPNTIREFVQAILDKDTRNLLIQPGIFAFLLRNLGVVPQVRRRAQGMAKKWRFFMEDAYMEKTVGEIRREFVINIL